MRKKKVQQQRDRMCDLFIFALLIDAVDRVQEQLTETPVLSDAEKAPYQAAIAGLDHLLVERAIAMGNDIIGEKGA